MKEILKTILLVVAITAFCIAAGWFMVANQYKLCSLTINIVGVRIVRMK